MASLTATIKVSERPTVRAPMKLTPVNNKMIRTPDPFRDPGRRLSRQKGRAHRCSGFVYDIHFDTRDRLPHKTGAHRLTDHCRDDLHTRLRLPPGVHDRDPLFPITRYTTERLRIERLSDGSNNPQGTEVCTDLGQVSPTFMKVRVAVGAV